MGDTKWAIQNGRYEMGVTKWAIRNGRYEMGDTKWAIRNGRYEMSDTKWAIRNGYNLQLVIYFSKNESSVHTTVRGGDVRTCGRVDGRVFRWDPGRKLSSFGARIQKDCTQTCQTKRRPTPILRVQTLRTREPSACDTPRKQLQPRPQQQAPT